MISFESAVTSEALLGALEVLAKAGIAVLCAAFIGWERELHGRPAGIRTHMLMALGVLIFSEVSRAYDPASPSRIASNVVTGVGFLGAGTILRTGLDVKGLTTAASIWAVTAIAMAVSVGGAFYWVALLGTLLTFVTLAVISGVEHRLAPNAHGAVLLVRIAERADIAIVLQALSNAGITISSVATESQDNDLMLRLGIIGDRNTALQCATGLSCVHSAQWADL